MIVNEDKDIEELDNRYHDEVNKYYGGKRTHTINIS